MDGMLVTQSLTIWVVVASAAATFFSPCILPLIPTYLSVISGVSFSELQDRTSEMRKKQLYAVIKGTLLFALGFSLVFITAGATATVIGTFLQQHKMLIMKIAGTVIIILGLSMLNIPFLRFLQFEKRMAAPNSKKSLFFPVIFGASFALGWSPCIGPILSTVLIYSAASDTVLKGIFLLALFSAILTVFFLIAGVLFVTALGLFKGINKYTGIIKIISALILIVAGILLLLNKFSF